MNAEYQLVKEIFLTAIEKQTPAEREVYLHEACGHDADLRRRVASLVNKHAQVGSFLEAPTFDVVIATDAQPVIEAFGMNIGPYQLLGQIGEGGFGVVFMAEQTEPVRRKVALKVLKPGMDTRQVIARFEAERQALAIMDHPNIAKVFDAGATPLGRPYFVMELVKGATITEFCDQQRLSPQHRLELFVSVCQAVQHAHQKGIIHRDLKPSNLLVAVQDMTPVVKVIDFGVAKALSQDLTDNTLFTGSAQMVGTPLYMSPEQAGMSDIDTRSDIYSLGVLLYELLTGTTPFPTGRFKHVAYEEIRRIIREEEPPKPSSRMGTLGQVATIASTSRMVDPRGLLRQCRKELDWIVMKCLEKDRNRRYETAAALVADVRRFLSDEPVQACPPSAWYRFRKLTRRNRPFLVMVSALVLAGLIGAGALAVSTALVWEANTGLKTSVDRERREAYFQRITVAHHQLSTDLAAALQALRECPEDLRGWEWYYLMRRCKVEPLVIRDRTEVLGVAFSPDGERIFSASGDGTIRTWNSRTGQPIGEFLAHGKAACCVVLHPDGKRLATAGADGLVKVWDLTTDPPARVFEGPCDALRKFGAAYTVAFSPMDGRRLAAGSEGAVRVWNWQTGQLLHSFTGHQHHSIPVAFSDDGRQVATGSSWQGQNVWDAETGQVLSTWLAHDLPVSALAFSPGNGRLATASLDRHVKLWETATGKLLHEFLHNGNVLGVAFSRDGKRLVSTGEDKSVRLWDTTTGREVLGLHGHTDSSGCVAFSLDGLRLASASMDGTIRVWDATPLQGDEGQDTNFAQHGDEIRSLAMSPDGEKIISAGHGGRVKIWSARQGQLIVDFTAYRLMVWSVAWHPDGQRIATAGSDGAQLAVKIWDARTGRQLVAITAEGGNQSVPFTVVAFSPKGDCRYLVTGTQAGAVQVWDATTGGPVGTLGSHEREIRGVTFSPDGKRLASASGDGWVKLWDATCLGAKQEPTLPPLRARVPGPCLNVAFSPDSQRLATGGQGNTVKIWDVQTGKELQTLRGHSGDVYTVAFSPVDDGRWIASGGEDSTVKIWDSRTGEEVHTFRGHTGLVTSVAFSPDGKRLYSGSRDMTVKVWDLTQMQPMVVH
jgi:WD40 repeat protein/serine/threonine protein kinase